MECSSGKSHANTKTINTESTVCTVLDYSFIYMSYHPILLNLLYLITLITTVWFVTFPRVRSAVLLTPEVLGRLEGVPVHLGSLVTVRLPVLLRRIVCGPVC